MLKKSFSYFFIIFFIIYKLKISNNSVELIILLVVKYRAISMNVLIENIETKNIDLFDPNKMPCSLNFHKNSNVNIKNSSILNEIRSHPSVLYLES